MWNEPSLETLLKIPPLYKTEHIPPGEKIIYQHFFLLSSDWYIAEYDSIDNIMFGYVILNGDYQNAEWGYIDYHELRNLNVRGFQVERDMYWYPTKAGDIEKIVKSNGIF